MANVCFLVPRESDNATLSGGSWVSSLPLANLQDRQPTFSARSTDAAPASTWFDIDAGSVAAWDALHFCRTNLSPAAQIQVDLAATQAGLDTPAATTGPQSVWPVSGRPTDPDMAWFDVFKRFTTPAYRWRRVRLFDGTNPAGYVELGRLVQGSLWQPQRNFSYDWEETTDPGDLRIVTAQKHTLTDEGLQPRLVTLPFNFASRADAEESFYELRRLCGTWRDVFVCRDPDATTLLHRKMLLATFEAAPRIVQRNSRVFSLVCALREKI